MSIRLNKEKAGAISARQASTELDCETAALLRAAIRPLFASAASWNGLTDILKDKGYQLAFRQGRLCLTDIATAKRVCGLRFLGLEFRDLVQRMGRPIVVARDSETGDLLASRPSVGNA
ncbi:MULTISPECIES: hypothetical protein [unclassified Ruegeria]|uniref:hypothetical protein n=1 Tax=unclassified Ruegeria TaxID=2625375 RepID=UPI001ADA8886|nr:MULTISPECIES: hypothetical protein [unclassified Ruegeria]MBO9411240.1 hypothetical protein [Ruegeria sp. R8_1]MBO9415441.1 hypothetical protein [Ruegeria sp. R8_2]